MPPQPPHYYCLNCLLGPIIWPFILGVLSLLAILTCFLRVRYTASHLIELFFVVAGVWLAPYLVGIPMFIAGAGLLLAHAVSFWNRPPASPNR